MTDILRQDVDWIYCELMTNQGVDERELYWRFRQYLRQLSARTGRTVGDLIATEFIADTYLEVLCRLRTYEAEVEMLRVLEKVRFGEKPSNFFNFYWARAKTFTGDLPGALEAVERGLQRGREEKNEASGMYEIAVPLYWFSGDMKTARKLDDTGSILIHGKRYPFWHKHLSEQMKKRATMQEMLMVHYARHTRSDRENAIYASTAKQRGMKWGMAKKGLLKFIPNLAPDAKEPCFYSGDMEIEVREKTYPASVLIKTNANGMSAWSTGSIEELPNWIAKHFRLLLVDLGGEEPARVTVTINAREIVTVMAEAKNGTRHYSFFWTGLYAELKGQAARDLERETRRERRHAVEDCIEGLVEEGRYAEAVHLAKTHFPEEMVCQTGSLGEAWLGYAASLPEDERADVYRDIKKHCGNAKRGRGAYYRGLTLMAEGRNTEAMQTLMECHYSLHAKAMAAECAKRWSTADTSMSFLERVDTLWAEVAKHEATWEKRWVSAAGRKKVITELCNLFTPFWPRKSDREAHVSLDRSDAGWTLTLLNGDNLFTAVWLDVVRARLPEALADRWTVKHCRTAAQETEERMPVAEELRATVEFPPVKYASQQRLADVKDGEWTAVGAQLWDAVRTENTAAIAAWHSFGATMRIVNLMLDPDSYKAKKTAHIKMAHALIAHLLKVCPEAFTLCGSLYGSKWGSYLILAIWDFAAVRAALTDFAAKNDAVKTLTLLSPHPLAPAVELKGGQAPVEEDLKTKVKQTTRFRTIYYAYDLDTMDVLDNLAPYAEDYYDD